MSSQGANAPAANRLGLRIAVPTPSQRAATVAAVAPLLTSSSSSTSISSVTAFTGTTPSSTAKRSSKNMLVHTWSQELVLAWLNQTLLPLLASAATPTTATVSASASASTARKSNKKGNDMELLDSVFNIADLSYLATPTSPASATPVLSLRDLKRAGIKNGKDLLGLNVASVKALLPYISPDERTIVLDAIEELKLMVLEATGDLKLAFGTNHKVPAAARTKVPLPPNLKQSLMPAAAKPPILASNVSTSKSSIDLGRLVINRTAEGSNAGTPIPSVAQAPSVSSKSFLERNIFANVMNPSASKIWEKCVKVYLLKPGEKFTSMIDISKARDGAGIRDAILDHPQFGLIGVSEEGRRNLALYAACDASGSYNEGQALTDSDLLAISKSSDINLRQLTLTLLVHKSVKVYSPIPGESKVIDVSMLFDGTAVREAIYRGFLQVPNSQIVFELFCVSEEGKIETDCKLDDTTLFNLVKSSNSENLKSLQLAASFPGDSINSTVLEKCIRVHTLSGNSRSIDVSKCVSGFAVRNEIFKKFRFQEEDRTGFHLYGLNVSGRLDDGLDDDTLFDISRSSDFNRKALLFLLNRQDFTRKGLDLEAAIAMAIKKSPSQGLVNERHRSALDGHASDSSSNDEPSPGGIQTPPAPASPLNFLSTRGWRQNSPTELSKQPQQLSQLASPLPTTRFLRPSVSDIFSLQQQEHSSLRFDTMSISTSRRTFRERDSIMNFSMRGGNAGSILSNSSRITFQGERPAVEDIAHNLELYFPQVQPLDTSDAVQGVLWYNEQDVFGGDAALVEGEEEEEEEEDLYVTRVSAIRKADLAASIYSGRAGARSSLLRANSTMGRTSSLHLASRDSRVSFANAPEILSGRTSLPSISERRVLPASPTAGIVGAAPTVVKRVGFRERLARFGSGGLFHSRDTTGTQNAVSPTIENVSAMPINEVDPHTDPKPEWIPQGVVQLAPSMTGQSKVSGSMQMPSLDRAEMFRRSMAGLVEVDLDDGVDIDDNSAHVVSLDGSEVDVYSTSFTSSESSGQKGDGLERDGEGEPFQLRWKDFIIMPNGSSSSSLKSGIDADDASICRRRSTAKSHRSGVGKASEDQPPSASTNETGTVVMTDVASLLPTHAQAASSNMDAMKVDLGPPLKERTSSFDQTMVEIPVPSLSGDTSKLASVTAVVPDVSTAPSSPVPDPDRPTIFTSEDIEPPIRRDIRWLKGDMIGKGSFGRVFYGVNLTTQDVMAVKQIDVIPISRYRNKAEAQKNRAKMIDSLRTEILLLNELHHENVVRYLGFDIDNTVVSVFLEYVSGGSVASMISRFGKFEEDLAQSLLVQILTGLEYLHERSVIHRDIKGGNILVNLDGTAKISDFGVSKKNELNMAYQLNSGLDFAGSVFWMAPEMSKNLGYSAKIDIWALGCVALEMLSGAHPWNGKGHMQAMYELRQGHSPPIPTGLTRGALSFLAHCFRMDPNERPTASELFEISDYMKVDPFIFDFVGWWEAKEELARFANARDSSIYSVDS